MTAFTEYSDRYENFKMEREDGILLVTLHSDGDTLVLSRKVHAELPRAFADIGDDRENRVVVMTGAGAEFGMLRGPLPGVADTPEHWDTIFKEGRQLLCNLLEIPVPVIAAVNGPSRLHSEIPLLSDIVLVAESTVFADSHHFPAGVVPGDGSHIVWPLLLGTNRGRYFLLTNQSITAAEALELGIVGEVLPSDRLLPRALEVAADLATQPTLTLRYSRQCLTLHLKRLMQDMLPLGFALEGLAYPGLGQGPRPPAVGAPGDERRDH